VSAPGRRDRTRPAELLGISAALAIGVGFIVFFSVRDLSTAGVWAGIAFIVIVVVMAMLVLAADPQAGRRRDDDPPSGH
jgi:peptidoglycan/LPS O-acetylase OafA/YrhL